ncbi:MAG: ABC transporter substrate-binding protein [Thermotogae bacterium]|nr:ABC transporter substrate-binding protein [Thermotogota bacterium]
MRYFNEFLGREVELPDRAERIVSLAPNVTDTLFRLGVGDRVVGVSLYCNRPRGLDLPRVGTYLNILWDKFLALEPDLVLTTTGVQRSVAERLLNEGIPVATAPLPNSVFGILENVRKVALLVDALPEGERLNFQLLKSLHKLVSSRFNLKAYYEIDLGGPITVGGPSYITDALSVVGIRNVYSFKREAYFKPEDTETVSLNMDLIIYETKPNRKYDTARIRKEMRERIGEVPVIVLPPDSLAHYGPSLLDEVLPALWEHLNTGRWRL